MAADICIEAIGFKAAKNYPVDADWARLALAEAKDAIARIDDTFLARINEDPGNEYDDLADYKNTLLNDLKEVERAVLEGHRHATVLAGGGGIVLLVSGGLSWGDAPTELFQSMFRLQEAEVFPDARWSRPADAAKPA